MVDLLVHINLSLQEMIQDFSATTDREPEVNAATYWLTELPRSDPEGDEVNAISFTRRVASAYRRPTGLVRHLHGTADGLSQAAAQVSPDALVFQNHVMTTGNYFGTWAAELAVHHLDLMVALPLDDRVVADRSAYGRVTAGKGAARRVERRGGRPGRLGPHTADARTAHGRRRAG